MCHMGQNDDGLDINRNRDSIFVSEPSKWEEKYVVLQTDFKFRDITHFCIGRRERLCS